MEIIPAIDIIDGKCVRLTEGDFARQTAYECSPLEAAKRFEAAGSRRLHMVDLDGAKRGSPVNIKALKTVAAYTNLIIDFGGGIKTDKDLEAVFGAGAAIVNVGSVAVNDPEKLSAWIDRFGDRILLAADIRGDRIATGGWQERTSIELIPFLQRWHQRGITHTFVTDAGRDGALTGPNVDLYRRIIRAVPELKLIASGGVSSIDDLRELSAVGCCGAIVGKALYEGKIDLTQLIEFQNAG